MTPYEEGYAELYDTFYADKPYAAEAAFLDSEFRAGSDGPSERLLDVACGTGRHALEFAGLGWDVVGLDRAPAMLDQARRRTTPRPIRFIEQDMTAIDLAGESFDAATCLFDSIGYAVGNASVLATLRGIRRHLRPDGLLGLEFWHAAAMLGHHEPFRLRRWHDEGTEIMRVSATSVDVWTGTATVEYDVVRFDQGGTYQRWQERHTNRYFQVQEMALLLDAAGLEPVRWHAGYSADAPIDGSTWHIVAIARARPHGA